ncbi:MAG: hypothetical protein JXR38_06515, partial [Bacilli bacterium]|nr:hypothetical protein [Bacilli bacterium]
MKKSIYFLFLLVFVLGITACNKITTTTETNIPATTTTTVTTETTTESTTSATTTETTVSLVSTTTIVDTSATTTTSSTVVSTTEAITLSFASIALASGSSDGELLLNISRAGEHGVIYFIIVAEGSQVPTAEQIVSGDDYGDVTVAAAGSADSYSNHVVASLTPGARYTLYTVIAHEQLRSIVRNMTQTAKLNVIAVDKGEGTEEDPFQISTVADLEQVGAGYYAADEKEWNMDSCYVLMNDIDLTDKYGPDLSDWPVLGSDSAGNRFSGVFDGAGFTILGLYVGPTSTAGAYRGLFAASEHAAVVKNLVLQDAVVTGAGIDESNSSHGTGVLFGYFKGSVENIRILNASVFDTGTRVGGLAGRSYESGHVRNVYVTGNVRGQNRVGGIAGVVDVSDSTATPIIYQNVVFDGEVIGETQHIGGLVGYLRGVQMSNVYVTGYIQGGQEVGGVAGFYQKRSGNNLIASSIDGAIVYATVYGTSSTPTIGYIVGQKSTTGITVENEHLLQVLNCFHVEGSQVINGGDPKAVLGTLVSQTDIGSSAWFVLNLPSFDFDDVWEFKLGAARPTLQATSDLGLLGELSLPLVLLPSFTSGPEEKQITVRISANKEDTTIYYAILDSQDTIPTVLELKDPTGLSGVLESGSDALVQATFTMPEFDTPYYVFYYAEHADGNSEVLQGTVTSKPMTELMIEGGLRPGDTDKEIILTLSSNLDGTINYIIVAQEGVYAKADILAPIDVLESGSGTTINIAFVMPNPETTYYVYAVAVLPDRESVVFSSSGLSSSENYVNYGTGSVADPFVIRTVTDLENIGNASYINDAEVALEYLSSANYILENDIDLTGEYGEGLLSWTPLPEFYGVLDGNGHSLLGLYINAPESVTHNGLFSYMRAGSVVKNLTLDGVYVNVLGQQSDGTNGMTGAIAGRMNSASMDNIRILNAEIISHGFRVGALAGGNEGTNGHLTNIYVEADVTGFARVGGIIGNITNSSTEAFNLKDFVFKGTVTMIGTSDFRVGGVVGWARGVAIQNGYVEGAIGGVGAIAGGVAGYMESYSDTATFAKIENVLVNVVVISSVGRSGGLIGNVSSTAYKVPTLTNAYQTLQTTMVIDGSQSTSVRHGTSVDETLFTAVWFETNMPGLASIDFWTFLSEADRPALNNSPDTGLIGLLEVPLVISDQIQTGSSEKEILVKLATNRLTDVIHYVVTLGGTFNATEIIDAVQGGTFLFVGEGQSIDQVHLMAEYGTIYTVHYVVVSGVEVSEVFVKSVTSGAEVALVIEATAVTGEVDPGDIEVDLQSTSHPASVWVLALPALDPAPSAETIKSTG